MSADFTPTMGTYTELKPFRYWCQKVLPLVYDDTLSYYELLCKVVDYLNKTMEDVDTLHTDVDNLNEAFELLQGYVNDYFDNLDVQTAINNKLDEMSEDGTLYALITPALPTIVSEWLTENIGPTTPAIDATLSVAGAGADAFQVGKRCLHGSNNPITSTDSPITLSSLAINTIWQYAMSPSNFTDLPSNFSNTQFTIMTFCGARNLDTAKVQIIMTQNAYTTDFYYRGLYGTTISAWMKIEKIIIDATLSNSGQAADAFQVGKRCLHGTNNPVTSVESPITLANNEINSVVQYALASTNFTDLPTGYTNNQSTVITIGGAWNFSAKVQFLFGQLDNNELYYRQIYGTRTGDWKKVLTEQDLIFPKGFLDSVPAGVTNLSDLPNNSVYTFSFTPSNPFPDAPDDSRWFVIMNFGGSASFPARVQLYMDLNTGGKNVYMRSIWGTTTQGWQLLNPDNPDNKTDIWLGYASPSGIAATGFVDACTKAANYSYPRINIAEGEYDIYTELGGDTYFSDTSHSTQPFLVPPNCEIVGHGNVVLSLEVPDAIAIQNTTLMEATSIIHTNGTGLTVKNINIVGKNIRYNVHDESGAMGWATIVDSIHTFENCKFIMSNPASTGHGSNIGCGSASGATYLYKDCIFINSRNDNIHFHTWYNSKGEKITFENCGFNGNAYSIGLGVHGENVCDVNIINCYAETDCRIYSESGSYTVNCFDVYIVSGNIDTVVQSSITSNPFTTHKIGTRT